MRIEVTPEMLRAGGGAVNAGAYESYLKALAISSATTRRGPRPGHRVARQCGEADRALALGFAQLGEAHA